MNLFLIGYRCSGKTTVGKAIAMKMDWGFVDSDIWAVEEYGKSIKDIIDTEGWAAFRRTERSILLRICSMDRQVVATGGGAVLDPNNVAAMQAGGMLVWLRATAETIRKRMRRDKKSGEFRPALTDSGPEAEIEDLLLKRNPYYEKAGDFIIRTDDLPVDAIARRIIEKILAGPATQ